MKLIYLMRFWPVFGGGETVTRSLVNEMSRRGHEVTVIYLWDRTNNTEVFVDGRVQLIRLEGISNINDGALVRSEFKRLRKELRVKFVQINPDIVINQWMPTKIVSKALKGLPARLIRCNHGSIRHEPVIRTVKQKIFYTLGGEWAKWMRMYPEYKQDFVYSDKWVLLSKGTYDEARHLLPWADKKRLGVVANPLPYEVNPLEINLNRKKKEILYVGRIVTLKRVPYLIDVWEKIENEVPDWIFRIVGDGDAFQEVQAYANMKQCKRIIFEGFKESRPFFQNASIMVLASAHEGFSMVSIEAQQCGCVPVITDSFATAKNIIKSDVNGILVENNNIDQFVSRLKELIFDDNKRNRLAIQGMQDSKRFGVRNICDKWETLFDNLEIQRGHEMKMRLKYIKNLILHKMKL